MSVYENLPINRIQKTLDKEEFWSCLGFAYLLWCGFSLEGVFVISICLQSRFASWFCQRSLGSRCSFASQFILVFEYENVVLVAFVVLLL